MSIRLESGLSHQDKAIEAINSVFKDVSIKIPNNTYQNPNIDLSSLSLKENIKLIQEGRHSEGAIPIGTQFKKEIEIGNYLNLDVKMETGTGKTYVYTKMMLELNRHYGFTKFIILVPSVAIKEGTSQFITSEYAKRHFADDYVGTQIECNVLNPQKKAKGRKMFPKAIREFVSTSRLVQNKIQVLIINSGMLTSKATMETRYDQTLISQFTQPYEVLRAVSPVVIIDEPHRFNRKQATFKCLIEKIQPQCVVRFGATFPELTGGKKDYENLIYNLTCTEAFNTNLIKGVATEYIEGVTEDDVKIRLMDITKNPKMAIFKNENNGRIYKLEKGASLIEIDTAFSGVDVLSISAKEVELSNGQVLKKSDSIYPHIYDATYQELMMKLALDRHFEKEKENFLRNDRIKTLALFFIDSVYSYRGNENDGHLKITFEKLLEEKLKKELDDINNTIEEREELKEYKVYIEDSLRDIAKTNGGYFSQDNSTSDEDIKKEVDRILRDKEQLLSFYNPDGTYNTMRFIFSKWTLKEGWDNPNIFTIAKLRTSGSEISKLQEVGRGLRLPVDEDGNRKAGEQFYLNYIVDYSERKFAEELKNEANKDSFVIVKLEDDDIKKLASARNIEPNMITAQLMLDGYIDMHLNILEGKREQLFELYPELNRGLKKDKVVNTNKGKLKKVTIRKDRYAQLDNLWKRVNEKYFISFEEIPEETVLKGIEKILSKGVGSSRVLTTNRMKTVKDNERIKIIQDGSKSITVKHKLPYSEFLKKINILTNIPIKVMHKALVEYFKEKTINEEFFNESTISEFVQEVHQWKLEVLMDKYHYQKITMPIGETALTNSNGKVKQDIIQGKIGIHVTEDNVPEKYLYNVCAYDSPKEKENIMHGNIDEVVVFGKIPRSSIRIPTYVGGTYSPDFMYVIKKKDGSMQLNLVVETKDVDGVEDLRSTENRKIESAIKFFEQLTKENPECEIRFEKQLKDKKIQTLITKALEK